MSTIGNYENAYLVKLINYENLAFEIFHEPTLLFRYATASARSDGMFLLCGGRDASGAVCGIFYAT